MNRVGDQEVMEMQEVMKIRRCWLFMQLRISLYFGSL